MSSGCYADNTKCYKLLFQLKNILSVSESKHFRSLVQSNPQSMSLVVLTATEIIINVNILSISEGKLSFRSSNPQSVSVVVLTATEIVIITLRLGAKSDFDISNLAYWVWLDNGFVA